MKKSFRRGERREPLINGFNFVAGAAIDFLNWAKGGVALKWATILQPSKPSKSRQSY